MPKKGNCAKSIKARNVMLAIRQDKAPWKDTKDLADCVSKLNPKKFGVILHDKERDEKDNTEPPGYHAMVTFDNARSVNNIAKQLGVPPQNIEIWDKGVNNGFAYLLHRTKKAQAEGKYQYEPSEVIANFDFEALMNTIVFEIDQAKIARDTNPKTLLDAVYAGVMTKEEAEKRLTGSQYAFYGKKLNDIWNKRLQNLAEEWRKEMIAAGKQVEVIWIFGESGTGKTSLAREIAEKMDRPYYKTGSSRDVFQKYTGEHTVILDEFREESMRYDDLLKILDPFSIYTNGSMAPSRFQDKTLAADTFIITTPYDPYQYYKLVVSDSESQKIDKYSQLLRRLTLILYMDNYKISAVKVQAGGYPQIIPGASRPNPYSQVNRPTSRPDPKDIFDRLFEATPPKTTEDTDQSKD